MDERGSEEWKRRRRRRWRRILAAAVLLLGGALAFWSTGWPGRILVEKTIRSALSAELAVEELSLAGRVRARDFRLFDGAAALGRDDYAIRIEDLDLDYAVFPRDGRYLPSLRMGALTLRLDGSDPNDTNYDFILAQLEKPASEDPLALLPREIEIGRLSSSITLPSMAVAIDGVSLSAGVEDMEVQSARLSGNHVTAEWWVTDPEKGQAIEKGVIDVHVLHEAGRIAANPLFISIPGLLEVAGEATVMSGGTCDVHFDPFRIESFDLRDAGLDVLPLPLRFDTIDLSGTHILGDMAAGLSGFAGSEVHAAIKGLSLGAIDEELYEGDLTLDFSVTPPDAESVPAQGIVNVGLNRGQRLSATFSGEPDRGQAKIQVGPWSREELLAVIPKAVRYHAETLTPLEAFEAKAEAQWSDGRYDIRFDATPRFGGAPLRVEGHGEGPVPGQEGTAAFSVSARLDGQSVTVKGEVGSMDPSPVRLSFDGVEPSYWAKTLANESILEPLDARLSGAVDIMDLNQMDPLNVHIELAASPLLFEGVGVPASETVRLAGDVLVGPGAYPRMSGPALEASVGEAAAVTLSDWWVKTSDFSAGADVTAALDLEPLGEWLPLGDLWGNLAVECAYRNEQGVHRADLKVRAEPLGYGDVAVLYGVPVEATGGFSFDGLGLQGAGEAWAVRFGEGTVIESEAWSFDVLTGAIELPLSAVSDLALFVDLGYLEAADGRLTASGQIGPEPGAAACNVQLDAASLTLPDTAATFSDLRLDVTANQGERLEGRGKLAASEILAAGAAIRKVAGRLVLEDDGVRTESLSGTLFGGTVDVQAQAAWPPSGLRAAVDVHIDKLDIEALIAEMAPDAAMFTGLASGDIRLVADGAGFQELTVDLRASENVTLDRDTVVELLAGSEPEAEEGRMGRLSRSAKQKAIDKVIGKEAQRAFDSATLTLSCTGPGLGGHGQLVIASEKLTITLDLPLDPGTLLKTLELRQFEKIQDIRAESNK